MSFPNDALCRFHRSSRGPVYWYSSPRSVETIRHSSFILRISTSFFRLIPLCSFAYFIFLPHPGGLSYREAFYLTEIAAQTKLLASLDVVEVNPLLGDEDDAKRTVSPHSHIPQ